MRYVIACIFFLMCVPSAASQSLTQQRDRMVRTQIEQRGIDDLSVLDAMRTVPRHQFVLARYTQYAYADRALPIGYGQTISQPYIVAYMTALIRPQPTHRVLEIGTGSGYQAAILAAIVDSVYSVEIVPELADAVAQRLAQLGYDTVRVKQGDGYHGWNEEAPFDAIIVTAAAEHIPPPLIEQLKDGGRMVIPVGTPFLTQTLMLVEKKGGAVTTRSLTPVRFVPFTRGQ